MLHLILWGLLVYRYLGDVQGYLKCSNLTGIVYNFHEIVKSLDPRHGIFDVRGVKRLANCLPKMNVARNLEGKFDSQQLALSKDAVIFCEINRDVFKKKNKFSSLSPQIEGNPVFYSEKRGINWGFAKIVLKITQTHVVQFLKTCKHHLKKHMML